MRQHKSPRARAARAAPWLALLAVAGLAGCFGGEAWFPADVDRWAKQVSQLEKQEHPAVILRHDKTYVYRLTRDSYLEETNHIAIMVMTEAGIDALASFALQSRNGAELKDYGARVISSGGEVSDLEGVTIYTEETLAEGETVKKTYFRIPGVTVGSTVEFYSVYRYGYLPPLLKENVGGGLPLLKYRLTVDVGPDLGYMFRTYNTSATGRVEKKATGGVLVHFALDDVPAGKREDFGADGSLTQPWWLFAIPNYGTEPSLVSSWDRAMKLQVARILVDEDEKIFDDPDLEIDTDACQNARCQALAAWRFVHEKTRFDGYNEWYRVRPLSQVLSSGYANNHEKAYLLYAALDEVGLDPTLAAVNRRLTRGYDFELPSNTWFNHQVVVLEGDEVQNGGLVLDPSCERCGLGRLPDGTAGRKALLYERDIRSAVRGQITATTRWRSLGDANQPAGAQRYRYGLDVDDEGKLKVAFRHEWTGEESVSPCIYDRRDDDADRKRRLKRDANRRFGHGTKVSDHVLRSCEATQGIAREGYTAAAATGVVMTDRRLLIPLGFLDTAYDGDLKPSERVNDLVIRRGGLSEEVVTITAPEGYVLAEAPAARVDGEAFSYELTTVPTANGATVTRRLRYRAGRYDKAAYEALRQPIRAYEHGTREVVVFVKRDWKQQMMSDRR